MLHLLYKEVGRVLLRTEMEHCHLSSLAIQSTTADCPNPGEQARAVLNKPFVSTQVLRTVLRRAASHYS